LHVGAKSYLLRQTMNHLEAHLNPRQFLRIHRSAIVNIRCIKEIRARLWGDYHAVLRDGTQLTLSRSYRKKLRGVLG
jgi:two-component system LytT family response regulator